jgi:hypothetical protein
MITAPLIRARIGTLVRSGPLTPYLAELIIDDARRQGPGGQVEIRLVHGDRASLDAIDLRLAALRRRGVSIVCRAARGPRPGSLAPDAA